MVGHLKQGWNFGVVETAWLVSLQFNQVFLCFCLVFGSSLVDGCFFFMVLSSAVVMISGRFDVLVDGFHGDFYLCSVRCN